MVQYPMESILAKHKLNEVLQQTAHATDLRMPRSALLILNRYIVPAQIIGSTFTVNPRVQGLVSLLRQ